MDNMQGHNEDAYAPGDNARVKKRAASTPPPRDYAGVEVVIPYHTPDCALDYVVVYEGHRVVFSGNATALKNYLKNVAVGGGRIRDNSGLKEVANVVKGIYAELQAEAEAEKAKIAEAEAEAEARANAGRWNIDSESHTADGIRLMLTMPNILEAMVANSIESLARRDMEKRLICDMEKRLGLRPKSLGDLGYRDAEIAPSLFGVDMSKPTDASRTTSFIKGFEDGAAKASFVKHVEEAMAKAGLIRVSEPARATPDPMPTPPSIPTEPAGVKYDDGKPRMSQMFGDFKVALEQVAALTNFGAGKYAPGNWRIVDNAVERYTDALIRHLMAFIAGETYDNESGAPHIIAVAWNALAIAELRKQGGLDV